MKKILLIALTWFLITLAIAFISSEAAAYVIVFSGLFVVCFGIYKFTKSFKIQFNSEPHSKSVEQEKIPDTPSESRKLTTTEYLWLNREEGIGDKFVKAYKDELEENDDYLMTKKEILEDFYDGDKIYKYEPFLVPFKVEDNKVYSYINEGEWILVGTVKKRDMVKLEQSKKTELYLMPNYFKKVYDEDVETDSGDSYFGLEVTYERE